LLALIHPRTHAVSQAAMNFETLSRWAEEELEALEKPGQGAFDDELKGDELGLFEGPSAMEEADAGDLPRIRLFLMNLWEWTDRDEQDFRDEVGTTFLHELGHYLGWDEDELIERGLD
jgi:hypothetical protein